MVCSAHCGSDDSVKSRIQEEYASLSTKDYVAIVGLRDLLPKPLSDLKKLEKGQLYRLPQTPIRVNIIISVMEIETWFLAEHSHFIKIDTALTSKHIKKHFGFDPASEDMQLRSAPKDDLENIYKSVGQTYEKPGRLTIAKLDYYDMVYELPKKYPSLKALTNEIINFLT